MTFSREILLAFAALSLAAGGCHRPTTLRDAAQALEKDDYDQTIVLANKALTEEPKGPKAAEALYIRGRAAEARVAKNNIQLAANMQAARASYVLALQQRPSPLLITYLRASLGKVAFFQDDFQTAIQQLSMAYAELKDRELKAASLFYLGKSQQRSGQFQQADQTFATIAKSFADLGWAQKAEAVRGATAFYLQLAVYEKPESIEAAAKLVQQRGLKTARFKDDQGRYLLRAGPYASYAQAKQLRPKVADAFPDATIMP